MKTKNKVTRKPKVEPWRAELARIVRFLNKSDGQSESLWDVLTALRGPDSNDYDQKVTSTCVIRATIGLKEDFDLATVETDKYGNEYLRENIPFGHFRRHAENAFTALGLKWNKLNK